MKVLASVSSLVGASRTMASRPATGRPLKIGLLGNAKPNCDVIVQSAFDGLAAQGLAAGNVLHIKKAGGYGLTPQALADLSTCDLVLNAIAN